MKAESGAPPQRQRSRRSFLRGAAGVAVALPFLESLPDRSAWAANERPIFSLFVCAVNGVVPAQFFPSDFGPLTQAELAAAGKATSHLARHAENLLFVSGISWPYATRADAHGEASCQVLTAARPASTGVNAVASGPSADVVIASHVHPGEDPLTLYAGNLKNGYMAERLSFDAAGQIRRAVDNPYQLYLELTGLAAPGGAMTPEAEQAARRLAQSRNSIYDLVREDLTALMQHPRLGSHDRQRLEAHFAALRDVEITMSGAREQCSLDGLDRERLEAYKDYVYDIRTTTEETLRLHMSLVALAFACNHRRTATIQWGDPTDRTRYAVPSNTGDFPFSFICHRTESDGGSGPVIPGAEQMHAEIDAVRMQSLATGLDHFAARGLADHCFVLWTNHFLDGPAHSVRNIPHIIWGNAGGYLKQAEHVNVAPGGIVYNNRLHNTLITAAIRDTGKVVEDFGDVEPGGPLEAILA